MSKRVLILSVTVCVAVCCTAAALAATPTTPRSTLPGTWVGSYDGAFKGTFRFTWAQTGTRLKGSIHLSNPVGNYGISGLVGRKGAIQFGVVGAGATYTGTLSSAGTSMSGSYKSPQGTGSWSAHKLSLRKKP